MFIHARYPQSMSLSLLSTVSVVFSQIPLLFRGVRPCRISREGTFGFRIGSCSSASVLSLWLVKINYYFSSIPFLCFCTDVWALSLAKWRSQLSQAEIFRKLTTPLPLPKPQADVIIIQGVQFHFSLLKA